MATVQELGQHVGTAAACEALGVPRASFYRDQHPCSELPRAGRPSPPRALTTSERQQVLEQLNSPRFVDQAPRQVYATLLDEGCTCARSGRCTVFWPRISR